MNKVISLLLLICFSGISFAQQQVGAKEALIVGLRLMNQTYKENVEIDTVYSYLGNNQDTLMYQITTKDGYYVLVSGSYACVPLLSRGLGESPKPLWEKEDAPPALNLLINSYIEQIEECFTNKTIL